MSANYANLQLLLDGIKKLPDDYAYFDMSTVYDHDTECGCLIYHGKVFGIGGTNSVDNSFHFEPIYESFLTYIIDTDGWRFIFSGGWVGTTISDAIDRLEYFIAHKGTGNWNKEYTLDSYS